MVVRLDRMLRYSLLLLAACAGSAPTKPKLANTQPTTTYQLQPLRVLGNEGRHSASHSTSDIAGSLELVGDRARLTLAISTSTGYVSCPKDRKFWPQHQACIENPPNGDGTSRSALVLAGRAIRTGDRVRVEVGIELQPDPAHPPYRIDAVLACRDELGSLACAPIVESRFEFLGGVSAMKFHRVRETPNALRASHVTVR